MSTGREQYRQYLQSEDWRKKREAKRKKRDRCAICGDTRRLDVHHLNYRNWFDVQQSDLRVLCRRCHELAHDLMNQGVIKFSKKSSHHARFTITKNAVSRVIGIDGMFWPKEQPPLPRSWRGKKRKSGPTSVGYTRAELAVWGVPWPPPKGWKKKLEARGINVVGKEDPEPANVAAFAPLWSAT